MNVLIIGNGGREHALAWKVAESDKVSTVFVAPGNGGTAVERKCKNINIAVTAIDQLIEFAQEKCVDLTIVGPELPLSLGIVDAFHAANLACFGPSKAAAQLESSKSFCKQFFADNHIPTAAFSTFHSSAPAIKYLHNQPLPVVIKASGLAAGKGVIIAEEMATAEQAVYDILDNNKFGNAEDGIVIEAFLSGEELSFIAIVDGTHVIPLASSQDHKRLLNNDKGPNTGGMGAYSPAPICTPELEQKIMRTVMQPTVDALRHAGTPYVGFLYAGLMIDAEENINVLEFNCRLGDPETQPLMMRLQSDLTDLCLLALNGKLEKTTIKWDPRTAICVVMAAQGYPETYRKGDIISGLDATYTDSKIFHAGTAITDNHTITNGGRVLSLTTLGDTIDSAKKQAYQQLKHLSWHGCHYRHDIGNKGLQHTVTN
jgi:phosphoribosylamine---glycine ligase